MNNNHIMLLILILTVLVILEIAFIIYVFVHKNRMSKKLYTDPVTNHENYDKFIEKAHRVFESNFAKEYVVIYLDIQKFRYINETLGHALGDAVLKGISELLEDLVGEDGFFCRMYSDNFVIMLKNTGREDISRKFEEMFELVRSGNSKYELEYNLILRAGIYELDGKNVDINNVIDLSIYAKCVIKNVDQSSLIFYNEDMKIKLIKEKELERDMHKALVNHQFQAYLQPKVDVYSKRIVGAEALVRWIHPVKGMIYPNDFIPFFEKNNFVLKLDMYMFQEVCQFHRRILDEGYNSVPIACNFSRKHLHSQGWVDKLKEIADSYDIPHDLFEIEITETVAEEDFNNVISVINDLSDNGFHISIDDFGSGYSAVQLLYKLPIDILKMDRNCLYQGDIHKIEDDIVNSIIQIAQQNGIKVVWEGIENDSHEDFVKKHGGRYVQGYLYSKPIEFPEFLTCLKMGSIYGGNNYSTDLGRIKVLPSTRDELEIKLKQTLSELEQIYSNLPGAILKVKCDDDLTLVYSTEKISYIYGYTKREIKEEFENKLSKLNVIEDMCEVLPRAYIQQQGAGYYFVKYRVHNKDGNIHNVVEYGKIVSEDEEMFYYGIIFDMTGLDD